MAAKDVRRLLWPALGWAAFVVISAVGFWRVTRVEVALEQQWAPVGQLWAAVLVGMHALLGFVLVGALVLEDPVVGDRIGWATRPVAGWRLLWAKALAGL